MIDRKTLLDPMVVQFLLPDFGLDDDDDPQLWLQPTLSISLSLSRLRLTFGQTEIAKRINFATSGM